MTTATATQPRARVIPAKPEHWIHRLTRRERLEKVWRRRYRAYLLGRPEPQPTATVLSADEAAFILRMPVIHTGNREPGLKALARLVEKRLLAGIVYSGSGGGHQMFLRSEVAACLKRMAEDR